MLPAVTVPRLIDSRALLAGIRIFAGLPKADLESLHAITGTRKLRAREVLFRKGDEGSTLYGVMRGRLRVYAASDAKEVTFRFLDPGEVFGEIALLDTQRRSATVAAMEPSELLTLHRRDLMPFLERHPKVAIQMAVTLAQQMRSLSDEIEDAKLLTIPGRLAKKLLALVQAYGKEVAGGGMRIDLKLPQHQLGEMVGATRESVNKQMRAWMEAGVIKVERGFITVLDEDALEDSAGYSVF
jgi:CRP/FNR family cyclic AMP-dependent transcriptional regulator